MPPELSRAGAGRRHAARDPRPGARRPRHHHRRRDAARELLQPLRHRARRRRHRQSRHRARPHRPSQSGAARRRQDPPQASGRGARREVPARQHRPHDQDHRARPVHHVAAGAERFLQATRRRWRSTTPPPSTPRSRTCSPPAPTSCRSTSPTCRRGRRRRAQYGLKALNARARRRQRHDRGAHLLRLRRRSSTCGRRAIRSCRSSPASPVQQVSIETAQSKLDCSVLEKLPGKTIILGVLDLSDMTIETPETVAARIRRALPHVPRRAHRRRAGLRHEIPAARGRLRQDVGDGRGRQDRARNCEICAHRSTLRSRPAPRRLASPAQRKSKSQPCSACVTRSV